MVENKKPPRWIKSAIVKWVAGIGYVLTVFLPLLMLLTSGGDFPRLSIALGVYSGVTCFSVSTLMLMLNSFHNDMLAKDAEEKEQQNA